MELKKDNHHTMEPRVITTENGRIASSIQVESDPPLDIEVQWTQPIQCPHRRGGIGLGKVDIMDKGYGERQEEMRGGGVFGTWSCPGWCFRASSLQLAPGSLKQLPVLRWVPAKLKPALSSLRPAPGSLDLLSALRHIPAKLQDVMPSLQSAPRKLPSNPCMKSLILSHQKKMQRNALRFALGESLAAMVDETSAKTAYLAGEGLFTFSLNIRFKNTDHSSLWKRKRKESRKTQNFSLSRRKIGMPVDNIRKAWWGTRRVE
ncbi:uncharacterized protein [Dasypus novemcinctus]|uniref:uncharacterized protein n=1 Tax=Dasypus novemcinctus TaxID=9361 RepID=UPI0039C8CB1B